MIEIQNLTKTYGSLTAVESLSLSVPKGQILGFLGPNGAGKSTTMRILTGYLSATGGSVTVDGLDVEEEPLAVKKKIGYLPESAPIYGDMLVYDYLLFIAGTRGITGKHLDESLMRAAKLCGIVEVMHRSVKTLSKGYRQRVGLALAMLDDPDVLILDEPTSGLDPNQIVEIRSIIKDIGREKTVIFSTHILSEAEATCDRVVIINKGKIVADGQADELKNALSGGVTVRILLENAVKEEVEERLSALSGVSKVTCSDQDGAILVLVSATVDPRKSLYEALKREPWELLEFAREKKSLEETFRDLTAGETLEETL